MNSLKKIVAEGLEAFPKLQFPLEISRFQLTHIVKILKISRVGHLKFFMVIPLTQRESYEVYSLIAHPIGISNVQLAMPQVKNIMFKNGEISYIITNKENVYSINLERHLLLNVEPIYNQAKLSCEWAAFQQLRDEVLKLCNFHKAGNMNDTFIIETDQHRLAYFTSQTAVEIDCPEKKIRDVLIGLHKLPLACDIKTEFVFWPAKQTVTINIVEEDEYNDLEYNELPMINVNETSVVHQSLKELINKLPKEIDNFTIDFESYGMTLEQIQTYTIISQSATAIMVIINSILIAFLFFRLIYGKKDRIKDFAGKLQGHQLWTNLGT